MRKASKVLLLAGVLLAIAAGTTMAADKFVPSSTGGGNNTRGDSGQASVAEPQVSGPLGGKTIKFKDSKKDKDHFYNSFSIRASHCTVSPGASITFSDGDGTRAIVADQADSANIHDTKDSITGKGTNDANGNLGFEFVELGDGFIRSNSTVTSSENIECA